MEMRRLKMHILGEEFMGSTDGAFTSTAPCAGVQPPQMDYPYPKIVQTRQCGEQGCTPALCQELNTMNTTRDHGTLNPLSYWGNILGTMQGWEVCGTGHHPRGDITRSAGGHRTTAMARSCLATTHQVVQGYSWK